MSFDIKKCNECGEVLSFGVRGSCIGFGCKCGTFGMYGTTFDNGNVIEILDGGNKHIDIQISKKKENKGFPKTFEECCYEGLGVYYFLDSEKYGSSYSVKCSGLTHIGMGAVDFNLFKNEESARRVELFMKLILAAEVYNEGWERIGDERYFGIFIEGRSDEYRILDSKYDSDGNNCIIKFKSQEIAKEFIRNFDDQLRELYSL